MSMEKLKKIQDQRVAFLGLGVENISLIKFLLLKKIKPEITICDFRTWEQLGERFDDLSQYENIKWQLGSEYNKKLDKFDILFRSPGWTINCPGIKEAQKIRGKSINLTSPMEFFLESCPTKNIIGVTGTKGKGTTSSLIFEILKQAKRRVWLGGNIGIATFDFLNKIKSTDWVILELSSFQLQGMSRSPKIAVFTNFTKEHQSPADPNNPNYHRSLKEYWEAKFNIVKWQKKGDSAVINIKLEARFKNKKLRSKKIYFNKSEMSSKLIGEHNKENIAAAIEVAKLAGINSSAIEKAVARFNGLEHRIEFVKEVCGVKYFDDSFATTPEAAVIALKSFKEPIILLAGGAEKKSEFKAFAKEIKKKVKFLILLAGEASPRIGIEAIKNGFNRKNIIIVRSMKDAVSMARKKSSSGEIVLLSTGCASFGMFKNYKERGKLFKEAVNEL